MVIIKYLTAGSSLAAVALRLASQADEQVT